MQGLLLAGNAALLVLFPVAWFAPLMTVALTWRFWSDGVQYSILSSLQTIWAEDAALALVVTGLAVLAPLVKVLGLMLVLAGLLSGVALGVLAAVGRLAMADVFLIAVYIVVLRGLEGGSITLHWGLWLFTGCVLGSLLLSLLTEAHLRRGAALRPLGPAGM